MRESLPYVARETMESEIHLGDFDGVARLFLTIDRHVRDILVIHLHKLRRLYEHTTTPACRIEDTPLEGLDDIDDELHEGGRREKFSSALTFCESEFAKKILINHPEHISLDVRRYLVKIPKKAYEDTILETCIRFRQDTSELRVKLLDTLHCIVEELTDISTLRLVEQKRESRRIWQIDHSPSDIILLSDRSRSPKFLFFLFVFSL